MIPLTIRAEVAAASNDFVVRVSRDTNGPADAWWHETLEDVLVTAAGEVRLPPKLWSELEGDVLLISPSRGTAQRLLRSSSRHNFFLVTEQCDQLCVMCSQPPKKTHHDQFGHFVAAAQWAPQNCTITITGGEPTLFKDDLVRLFEHTRAVRPDVSFRVLSNAQHFDVVDANWLKVFSDQVTWGVPLYSSIPATHDQIVGKTGAFELALNGLSILFRSGAPIELRTVVMTDNVASLVETAKFVSLNASFVYRWAIMQLEPVGFARGRWQKLFHDSSLDFDAIGRAVDIARLAGLEATLFNFPLCTVPAAYRQFAPKTISDWKNKFLETCEGCVVREHCGGFFEWYPELTGFKKVGLR